MDRKDRPRTVDSSEILAVGREVLLTEAEAVTALAARLDGGFVDAVRTVLDCSGRVVVTGIGKSGHIARKIAATLASTGTPALFVHPAEAQHGDLGMIISGDVVIALSNSGESDELMVIIPMIKRLGARLIAIVGNTTSSLARQADIRLDASVEREAGPLGLAPTSSTAAQLALGDALALALLKSRGLGAEEFAKSHPAGRLGKRLLVTVNDLMHDGDRCPKISSDAMVIDALIEMSGKGLGMTGVVDEQSRLQGIFTDGDLRRALERGSDLRSTPIRDVMSRNPHSISSDRLAAEALAYMERFKINGLVVTDDDGRLVGAFNMHDLFRAGVV